MKVTEIKVSYKPKVNKSITIKQSQDIYDLLLDEFSTGTLQMQEEVKVILLNRANIVLGIYHHSKGGISSCIVDIKLILSVALKALSSNIILVHNHPSGNLKPSKADITITKKLKKACNYLEINLLDHIIYGIEDYYSFADEGMF